MLTNKCTATCDICCFECSPQLEEKMPLDLAIEIIEQSAEMTKIETIGFSGGEPFLEYQSLLQLIALTTDMKKKAVCTSNGFWGTSFDKAFQIVKEIKGAGLFKLSVSVDLYHSEYVNVENIRNIMKAAFDLGLQIDIGSVITKSKCDLSEIFKKLGGQMSGIAHHTVACLPVGTALHKIDKSDFIFDEHILKRDNHCFDTSYFAIHPNYILLC